METRKKQTTTQQSNRSKNSCDISSEELGEIFHMYHPMENNSSYKVDDDYMKRFEKIFGVETK